MVTSAIRPIGRATLGVKLIGMEEGDQVVSVARLAEKEGDEGATNGDATNGTEPAPEAPENSNVDGDTKLEE